MRKLLVLSSNTLGGPVALQLRRRDWQLDHARSGPHARQILAQRDFLVGLSVFWDEDTDEHCAALAAIIADYPDIRWVAALPRNAVQRESCAALIATGLYDYFSLPLEAERLSVVLGHAYGMTEVGIRFLQQQQDAAAGRFGMLGRSPAMRSLFRNMEWAAHSDAPVLIIGETGTGKETTARAIHTSSSRANHPFLPVSSGTISPAAIDRLLFGAEGAASEGGRRSPGTLESVDGGTLFLDDIADMAPGAKARLLGFLTERERSKDGNGQPRALDVRIIAASPYDLDEPVASGRMLSDLFYRLAVIVMRIPPLRERPEDLEMLAEHFLKEAAKQTQSRAIGVSRAALAAMKQYHWPGNLLELSNHIFRAVLFSKALHLSPRDLDLPKYASDPEPLSLDQSRERAERETLRLALARNRRNVTRAARELQISRMTLYRLLDKHGMDRRG